MLLFLRCLFEVQFFVEKYALFLVGAGISCSFFLKGGVGFRVEVQFFVGNARNAQFWGSKVWGSILSIKKAFAITLTAKLLLPWS